MILSTPTPDLHPSSLYIMSKMKMREANQKATKMVFN